MIGETDLIIPLATSARPRLSRSVEGVYLIDEISAIPDQPDWVLYPDILVDTSRGRIVGLTYWIAPKWLAEAARAAVGWDQSRVRTVEASSPDCRARYEHGMEDGAFLEVRWEDDAQATQMLAQLYAASWLRDTEAGGFVGIVLPDCVETVEEYGFQLALS